jgi:SAM-dependent methyltransferase
MHRFAHYAPRPVRRLVRPWITQMRYAPVWSDVRARRWLFLPVTIVDAVRDRVARARGGEPGIVPPRWLRYVGRGDFEATGTEFLGHAVTLAALQSDAAVLDIGSGSGRLAIPLARFLRPPGRYLGFDIVPGAVTWCTRHITAHHPYMTFRRIDAHNRRYRPRTARSPLDVRFPADDASFDVAIAMSVFTHLAPEVLEHYAAEVARVLRPGGQLLATFFLLDADGDAEGRIASGASTLRFVRDDGRHATLAQRRGDPDFAVAYDEAFIRTVLADAGLRIVEPVHRGTWSGRPDGLSGQDIVIAERQPNRSLRP